MKKRFEATFSYTVDESEEGTKTSPKNELSLLRDYMQSWFENSGVKGKITVKEIK